MFNIEPKAAKKFYVKPEHLTGAIADFPLHIVQLMVDEQVRQGNKADPSVFAAAVDAVYAVGGFSWENSVFGRSIWEAIINDKKFYLVPEPKYPCTTTEKPKGHVHAQLMKQYGEDAATHEKPWELWEFYDAGTDAWWPLDTHPCWPIDTQYRRKSDDRVELAENPQPTPNEIIRAMMDKGMVVWACMSDESYDDARGKIGHYMYRVFAYDADDYYTVRTRDVGWRYAVPIDIATMAEITELPK